MAGAFSTGHCPSWARAEGHLLEVNQDSPDPEWALEHPEFQQLANIHASSCHPMLEFAGFHARLCRTLLAQMSGFAAPFLQLRSLLRRHKSRRNPRNGGGESMPSAITMATTCGRHRTNVSMAATAIAI